MGKYTFSYAGTLYSSENEWARATHITMCKSHKYNEKQKKARYTKYIQCDST